LTTAGMTATNPTAHETLRKADLGQIAQLLESQRVRTADVSIQGRNLWVANGNLIIQGVEPVVDLGVDGVTTTDVNGVYAFSNIGIESMAARLDIPQNHLRDLRANKTDLFDTVAGYYLRGELNGEPSPYVTPDGRIHTLRLLAADKAAEGNEVDGMVRAMLGGNYLAIDSLDILSSVVEGMGDAGVTPHNCKIEADLTESRMVVKVWVPGIQTLAPDLLGGYRSPFTGKSGTDVPVVFAGLVFSNSEVGRGAWSVAPRVVFEVCTNGMTIAKDAVARKHVGEKLDGDGVIQWSQKTQAANLKLIQAKTADATKAFLDVDYLKAKIAEIEQAAKVKIKDDPEVVITKVTRHTGHQGQRSAILNAFIQGGQMTAGGVMQAYTAAAQLTTSGDTAFDMENRALDAMQFVAARAN
jgi:hypothetical protein